MIDLVSVTQALLVAEHLSFSRAAQVLGVRQSAVSRRVRALEDKLGVSLFERDNTGVRITEAGRRFLERTREPPSVIDQLILRAKVTGELVDLRGEVAAQVLGGQLHQAGRTGLAFASVRRPGGHCVGILRPKAISGCRHSRPFSYYWDGARIAGWR